MVERDRQEDKQGNISGSGLSPFKSNIYGHDISSILILRGSHNYY